MAKSKKPIFYLARCKKCNHHVYASDYILYPDDKGKLKFHRVNGSAKILKMKMAEHMSKSHNESWGLSSTIPLNDYTEVFAIDRIRGEKIVKMFIVLAHTKHFWYVRRNEAKLMRIRLQT